MFDALLSLGIGKILIFLGQIFNKYLIIFGKIFGEIFDLSQNIDFSPKILIFKVLKQES